MEQPQQQIAAPLVAHAETPASEKPRQRALDDPPRSPQALTRINPSASDSGGNATYTKGMSKGRGVIGLVGVELRRALARTTRLPSWSDDRRDGVN